GLVLTLEQFGWLQIYDLEKGLWSEQNLTRLTVPAFIVSLNLLAIQIRYARSEAGGYISEEFVKVARAKGASHIRVAKHVLVNSWAPLFSVFLAEFLGTVFLSVIIVEYAFSIPGIGEVILQGFNDRDPGIVLGASYMAVIIGVAGRLLRDVASAVYDPRVWQGGEE
ncbi:MAG: ABC transporter permease subunit, partial [Halobacteriaceae archaeon]